MFLCFFFNFCYWTWKKKEPYQRITWVLDSLPYRHCIAATHYPLVFGIVAPEGNLLLCCEPRQALISIWVEPLLHLGQGFFPWCSQCCPCSFHIPQALGFTGRTSNCQKNCSSFPEGFLWPLEPALLTLDRLKVLGNGTPTQSNLQGILDGDWWINTSAPSALTWDGPEAQLLLVPSFPMEF